MPRLGDIIKGRLATVEFVEGDRTLWMCVVLGPTSSHDVLFWGARLKEEEEELEEEEEGDCSVGGVLDSILRGRHEMASLLTGLASKVLEGCIIGHKGWLLILVFCILSRNIRCYASIPKTHTMPTSYFSF